MKPTMTMLAFLLLPAVAHAQNNAQVSGRSDRSTCTVTQGGGAAHQPNAEQQQYDVVLDVRNVCVERIHLRVKNVDARVALNAVVANLVRVQAGANAHISTVDLTIQGVEAQAELLVDLDDIASIVDNVFTMLDNHPEMIKQIYSTANGAIGTVGNLAQTALQPGGVVSQTVNTVGGVLNNVTLPGGLLSQTVNTLGQTVVRTLDTTGRIVERTVDSAGKVLGETAAGSVSALSLVKEVAGTAGAMTRTVRDTTGKLIEYTIDSAGKITNARVLSSATNR